MLDDLTANNKAVLASLGGRPAKMNEFAGSDEEEGEEDEDNQMRETEGMESMHTGEESELRRRRSHSAVRQRAGSITRGPLHKVRSHSSRGETRDSEAHIEE